MSEKRETVSTSENRIVQLQKDYAYPCMIEYIGEYLQTCDKECRALLARIED